jgi:4-hydroxybenzoate polyprenyltransferase
MIQAAIDFLAQNGTQINRFWINRLVKRNNNVIAIQTANLLRKERHNVSEEDLCNYFDTVSIQLEKVPSLFVWNADETRVGIPKKCASPQVIVAKQTRPRTVRVPKERDDNQLTTLTAISAFGDSNPPMFISKSKIFLSEVLIEQQLYHGHDYIIRNSAKTFITEVLFIDWLQTQFIPKTDELRRIIDYGGPIILLVDSHTSYITPRVLAYAASQKIIVIKLVAHSSHVSQPLDLSVFGVFKMLCKREAKTHKMKGEALKIYLAILAFYKATIIPMVR